MMPRGTCDDRMAAMNRASRHWQRVLNIIDHDLAYAVTVRVCLYVCFPPPSHSLSLSQHSLSPSAYLVHQHWDIMTTVPVCVCV